MQNNRIQLAGYAAARAELRYLPSGMKVTNLRLGETYRYAGKDGKELSYTNWHSLTFYGDLADAALAFEKGDNLFVEGSLQQRQFTPADGVKRTVHEVVVRSFHVIAPSRSQSRAGGSGTDGAAKDAGVHYEDRSEGGPIDVDRPVGPA